MSVNVAFSNYNGKQPNSTAYVKTFIAGTPTNLWKANHIKNTSLGTVTTFITPSGGVYDNLYIPGDLYVGGVIVNPSDARLKTNIQSIQSEETDKLMNLRPAKFNFVNDKSGHIHYGFIAQEFAQEYPELISIKPDNKVNDLKAINYLEIIPLLVDKIQSMQKEIDDLKQRIDVSDTSIENN